MITLRTAISLLVAAGLSIGGMLATGEQARAKVRSSARAVVQAAGEVAAGLQAEANELRESVEFGAEARANAGAGGEGRVEGGAESYGNLELDGPFDLGSWLDLNIFGSADGSAGW